MKMRKGFYIVWPDGTKWKGDCPGWAAEGVRLGYRLEHIRILGRREPCPSCSQGFKH